jgi:hypothetical protein
MLGVAAHHVVRQGHARDARTGRFIERAPQGVLRMTEREDLRERVKGLEVQVAQLNDHLNKTAAKVTEIHEILVAARGARWFLFALVGVGGFLAGKLGSISPGIFK